MFRYFLVPHSFVAMYLSLAQTSIKADAPSGKQPTTLVLLRISRFRRSRMGVQIDGHPQVVLLLRIYQGRFRSRGCDTAEGRGYRRWLLENIQADSQGWTSVESQEGPPCLRGDSFQQAKAVAQTLASPCQESARDTGPEFISHEFQDWCDGNGIKILYTQPGCPTQNSYIERFNGSYRRAVLDAYIFRTLDDVREITEKWTDYYNNERPRDSLNNLVPMEYRLMRTG